MLMLRQVVLIVMLGVVVRSVGEVGSCTLSSHFFLEVTFTAVSVVSWVVWVALSIIGAISIWVLSLMLVKTAIVWALSVWISDGVVVARASLVAWGTVRVLGVAVVLLLKHIVMLISLLHLLAFSTGVLIGWLTLDRLKGCGLVLQSTVPFDRGVRLHLEDEMTILDVGLAGVEGG